MTHIDHPDSKTVELWIDGKIHEHDYLATIQHLEKKIEQWGSVNLLENIHSFDGFELGAFWDNVKFGMKHFKDVQKFAVVTDKMWIRKVSEWAEPLTHMQIKTFPREDLLKARAWCSTSRRKDVAAILFPPGS